MKPITAALAVLTLAAAPAALAQPKPQDCPPASAATTPETKSAAASDPTQIDTTGSGNQMQPQGPTGPINTASGGAPPESPQGQSPPGMQPAPLGSGKVICTDEGGVPQGTPAQ